MEAYLSLDLYIMFTLEQGWAISFSKWSHEKPEPCWKDEVEFYSAQY